MTSVNSALFDAMERIFGRDKLKEARAHYDRCLRAVTWYEDRIEAVRGTRREWANDKKLAEARVALDEAQRELLVLERAAAAEDEREGLRRDDLRRRMEELRPDMALWRRE